MITTRANSVGSLATSLDVETMGLMEGTHLLLRRAQRFERASDEEINEAGNIVVALDHFPLALDQAGAYIEESGLSFDGYLQVYQNRRKEVLARRGAEATNYPDSVATTWSLSFQKIERGNPAAAELLRLLTFLAPDAIPEELIRDGVDHWSPLLQQAVVNLFTFNKLLEDLLRFSLVKRLVANQTISIHRLVQIVQRDAMEPKVQYQWAERVILAVNRVFPDNPKDIATWSQCLRYLDQVQACDLLIEEYTLPLIEAGYLLNRAGVYLYDHASYAIAKPLYERALAILEQQLGPEHPSVAAALNNLASLYTNQSKYTEAELLLKRALAIREQQLGSEHPDTANSLNNLASLYDDQGKYEQAKPLYERALVIREQQLGPEHPTTATTLGNLALLYKNLGKYTEAGPLYERALAIDEKVHGPDHPDVAIDLSNLASLYKGLGKHEQAEPLYERALAIDEKVYGLDHPEVATNLNNLASLCEDLGKYERAKPLYERALAIQEQRLGPEHSDVATTLGNLGGLYQTRGQYTEAELLLKRALTICKQQLGVTHPHTARSLNNLAELYRSQGKYKQAEPLYQHALAILESVFGHNHHNTQIVRENYLSLLQTRERNVKGKKRRILRWRF